MASFRLKRPEGSLRYFFESPDFVVSNGGAERKDSSSSATANALATLGNEWDSSLSSCEGDQYFKRDGLLSVGDQRPAVSSLSVLEFITNLLTAGFMSHVPDLSKLYSIYCKILFFPYITTFLVLIHGSSTPEEAAGSTIASKHFFEL